MVQYMMVIGNLEKDVVLVPSAFLRQMVDIQNNTLVDGKMTRDM